MDELRTTVEALVSVVGSISVRYLQLALTHLGTSRLWGCVGVALCLLYPLVPGHVLVYFVSGLLTVTLLCQITALLNLTCDCTAPRVDGRNKAFIEHLLLRCPSLTTQYRPPLLWGRNGHLQVYALGIIGRLSVQRPNWRRCYINDSDGSTVSYELAEPKDTALRDELGDVTLVLAPGFNNYSDTNYIRYFTRSAQQSGYRCVVLNHVGMTPGVRVTGSRIFTIGYTGDLALLVDHLTASYPSTRILLVGYSMGANIVVKYLGEQRIRPRAVVGAISVCQGYSILDYSGLIPAMRGLHKFYFLYIAIWYKRYILAHRHVLLTDKVKKRFDLDEQKITRAKNIMELDEQYSRRIYGYPNLHDFYKDSSCLFHLEKVEVPLVMINSKDDPMVPYSRVQAVRQIANRHDKATLIELEHGGHLGFYENGLVIPSRTPWIDRALLEIASVMVK